MGFLITPGKIPRNYKRNEEIRIKGGFNLIKLKEKFPNQNFPDPKEN